MENESLLQRIGPQDRAIFHLRYFEGYTAREIAEMLNLPAGTVRSRLSRCRKSLKNELEETDMANKLMINCASCDARNIAEENYTHYESITINSATVLTNAEAKAVMNRLPVTLNCAQRHRGGGRCGLPHC